MTHDQIIEVIQAHKRGEAIEFRRFGAEQWTPTCAPAWDFNRCDYRVKPTKPLEGWVNVYPKGQMYGYPTLARADAAADGNRVRCVHMREVTDE